MRKENIERFKRFLLDERRKQASIAGFMDEGGLNVSMGESTSELSAYDNHPADIGSENFERSKDFALREQAMLTITAIDEALQKIEEGTYGVCGVCGRDISAERLEAVPHADKCADCKEEEEKVSGVNERPVEEEVLAPPFARTFNDDEDKVEYDGEDAWQEVQRYSETTDEWSRGGSYYGYSDFDNVEDRGTVEEVDSIPYEVGDDGVIYKSFTGMDDESAPAEKIDVGVEH